MQFQCEPSCISNQSEIVVRSALQRRNDCLYRTAQHIKSHPSPNVDISQTVERIRWNLDEVIHSVKHKSLTEATRAEGCAVLQNGVVAGNRIQCIALGLPQMDGVRCVLIISQQCV